MSETFHFSASLSSCLHFQALPILFGPYAQERRLFFFLLPSTLSFTAAHELTSQPPPSPTPRVNSTAPYIVDTNNVN